MHQMEKFNFASFDEEDLKTISTGGGEPFFELKDLESIAHNLTPQKNKNLLPQALIQKSSKKNAEKGLKMAMHKVFLKLQQKIMTKKKSSLIN